MYAHHLKGRKPLLLKRFVHAKPIQGVLFQRTKVLHKPPIDPPQLSRTLISVLPEFKCMFIIFMEIYTLVKISAHTNRRTLILAFSLYKTQKVSTSFLVLICYLI